MEIFLGAILGIVIGFTASVLILLHPISEKDKLIDEQRQENLQVCSENKEIRAELEEVETDLATANEELELKDEVIKKMEKEIARNNYNRTDLKLAKLKELVKDYQEIN